MNYLLLLFFLPLTLSYFLVDPTSSQIVDLHHRQVLFHGVNAITKVPPYYPDYTGPFNSNFSLNALDAQHLKSWGFNMIRLFVGWEATEIAEKKYDMEYLKNLEEIVELLGKFGIYTVLDMHQDVASPYTCGEGFPDFYIEDLKPEFPFPFPFPYDIPIDPKTGYRDKKVCLEHNFAEYYVSVAVCEIFQELYTKGSKMREGWKGFWETVVKYFADNENILGYELINEPWLGDVYKDIELFESGKTDEKYLFPLYKELYEECIYPNDKNHMIFFEPAVEDLARTGFKSCPFGNDKENITRCIFAWHVYCGIVDTHGDPKIRVLCDALDDWFIETRDLDWKAIGGGTFATEFGASGNSSKSVETITWVVNELEKRMMSWSYWQFKYFGDYTTQDKPATVESFYDNYGNLQSAKVKALSRTYAQYTCGVGVTNSFNPEDSTWTYVFKYFDCGKVGTQVFLNEDYYYPNGFDVDIQPMNALKVTKLEKNYILLTAEDWVKEGLLITITILKK